ncbi:Epiplakin [Fukomys damarensis]|uniref:Epiplakin n=1 Tax=Fukomys damarensis TaxID=885580 RepID=A0A091E6B8_FUKDA|nr:Epiplakin [Fukomys damarensis]
MGLGLQSRNGDNDVHASAEELRATLSVLVTLPLLESIMGNWASRLGCLGERRSGLRAGSKAQEDSSPSADLQGLHPPGVSWAWWGTRAIQVTEVTETVVTETVVTEAVEVGPGQQGKQLTEVPPELLNTLQSWLDGMEELQASQGPLAADAVVAAAQLQEQELLQHLLEERAPQVEPRLQEVGSPAKLCAQWHHLVQWAETRLRLLQQVVPAAQSFDAARETLLARLGPGEQLLVELEEGQLGPKGQERVMQCLQHVCEEATACAKDLGRALETGQRLAELLAEDEARLVNQQLEGLRECVKLTVSGAARVWQMLLCAQKIGSCELLPPTGLEAQLDLEEVTSEGPGLKDQEELSVQLAQLAEWLEQLASQVEVPGQEATSMVPIQEQCLPPSTLGPSMVQPGLDLTDNVLASGEQGEDGLGCLATYGGHETTSQCITMLGSELPNSQQPLPHCMARAGDTGTGCQRWVHGPGSLGEQVARGTLMVRVGGGWVALDEFLVKNDPDRGVFTGCPASPRFRNRHQLPHLTATPPPPSRGVEGLRTQHGRLLGRKQVDLRRVWHNQLYAMNGQTSPLDVLVTSSTEQAMVTKNMKAGLEASNPFRPQVETALCTKAKSIAGVYVEASGQTQSIYVATKQGLLPTVLGLALLEAQAATGGLVDPTQGQLLSVSKALQQGLVGLELKEKLLAAERAVTGYPDPYGDGKLSLFQAIGKEVVERTLGWRWLEAQLATGGLVDPTQGVRVAPEVACQQGLLDQETWLSLSQLVSSTDAPGFFDPNTLEQLRYGTLLARCVQAPGSGLALLSLKTTFCTLGGAASVSELLEAGVLDKEVVQGLQEGTLAVSDVSMRPEVQRYLEGTSSVVGIVLLPEGQKKGFFKATTEHLLSMGTALPLLEAQAATHTLVDPATGQRLWVDEAVKAGLVGPELHKQLLVAEQAVTGYHDPFSSSRIPLFQAMKKELVDQALALRLLDAQLATGGLVCPARRFRLPLEAALCLGCLDEETQQHLSQAAGFSDPSTHGSVSYEQLLASCVTDPETGLTFLPLFGKPLGEVLQGSTFIEHHTRQALSAATASVSVGKFQGRAASLWELLFSEAVPVEQRVLLAQQYQEGALSMEELAAQLKAIIEQAAATTRVTFAGLRDTVTPAELLKAEIIDQELYEQLERGQASAKDVGSLDSVQRYLQGTGCIAGLLLPGSQERLSIYEARSKRLLRPGTALILLEAQAATGFIIDPKGNKRYSVKEALRADVIGPDVYAKLLSAERAVTGYTDPYTGEQISLFQAMQRDLIVHHHGIRLLEAQIATGGIIDPVHSHRVPVDVAYQRGYFDQMLNSILLDPSDDTKGFFDPNTHENLTYLQLLERCIRDPETGLYLLPLSSTQPQLIDGATRETFQNLLLSVSCIARGLVPTKGQPGHQEKMSIYQAMWKGLLRPGTALVLLEAQAATGFVIDPVHNRKLSHAAGPLALPDLVAILIRAVEEAEAEAQARLSGVSFRGLRRQVSVSELQKSGILGPETLRDLAQGTMTPQEGQPGHQEKMSIYQAMWKGLLRPGTALVLLEAQAATGFVIDPVHNRKLSVEDAVAEGVVGGEIREKLLSAERAVTGYTDPYSGEQISLFQAMQRDLIVRDHGIRLLEAQIATGGVIDPVHSHRVPVDVAYQRGYFDQEMSRVLADPGDDTKGFFDPNTHENLTYLQLLQRATVDPETGLLFLRLL